MSILQGIDELVDDWLDVEPIGKPPYFRHKSTAIELSRRTTRIRDARPFLDACYSRIQQNWLAAIDSGYTNPSKENWRWKRHLDLAPQNASPELQLERAIVASCGESWSNQMPVASGLVGPASNKRAAVDLVYREDPTTYSLIELKVDSDNPLFAAIEILIYGLLFAWSKNNQETLGYDKQNQPVLGAIDITLGVLAPERFFDGLNLSAFATVLNRGLAEFGEQHGLLLAFEFCQLGTDIDLMADTKLAIDTRHRIWGDEL
jgi:hypothetical protein